jgi:hypothetical protein
VWLGEVWWSVAKCCNAVLVLEIRCQTLLEDIQTICSCSLYILLLPHSFIFNVYLVVFLFNTVINVFLLLCLIVCLCTYCIFMYLFYVYVFIVCLS